MPNQPFYKTPEWQKARARALYRAAHRCENCGADVRAKGASRVDHKVPRATAPELALEQSNLRVLCIPCDAIRHAHKGSGTPAGVWADPRPVNDRGFPLSPAHHWNRRPQS